jgi:hypothetical protein
VSAAIDPFLAILGDSRAAAHPGPLSGVLGGSESVYLWGNSRPVVNSVLYALARRMDPDFTWLHVRDRGASASIDHFLAEGMNRSAASTIAVRPRDLVPGPKVKAASLSWLVSFDERPEELDQLRAFLALPEVFQEAVGRTVPPGTPRVLAIPNSDRLADLFTGRIHMLGALARILKESSVSIMVGQSEKNGPLREVFDYAFEVRATDLSSWKQGRLICERTPQEKVNFTGLDLPLDGLSWATDILTAATQLVTD